MRKHIFHQRYVTGHVSVKYGVKLDTDKIEVTYNSGSNHSVSLSEKNQK